MVLDTLIVYDHGLSDGRARSSLGRREEGCLHRRRAKGSIRIARLGSEGGRPRAFALDVVVDRCCGCGRVRCRSHPVAGSSPTSGTSVFRAAMDERRRALTRLDLREPSMFVAQRGGVFREERHYEILRVLAEVLHERGDPVGIDRL